MQERVRDREKKGRPPYPPSLTTAAADAARCARFWSWHLPEACASADVVARLAQPANVAWLGPRFLKQVLVDCATETAAAAEESRNQA